MWANRELSEREPHSSRMKLTKPVLRIYQCSDGASQLIRVFPAINAAATGMPRVAPPEAGRRCGSAISWGAVRRPTLHPLLILPRSRHLPVASTEGSLARNLNRIGLMPKLADGCASSGVRSNTSFKSITASPAEMLIASYEE